MILPSLPSSLFRLGKWAHQSFDPTHQPNRTSSKHQFNDWNMKLGGVDIECVSTCVPRVLEQVPNSSVGTLTPTARTRAGFPVSSTGSQFYLAKVQCPARVKN